MFGLFGNKTKKKYEYLYWYAPLYAFIVYLAYHVLFIVRFGRIHVDQNAGDVFLFVSATLVFLLFFYFQNKLDCYHQQSILWAVFFLILPFSMMGAIVGGLLGPIGVVIYGLIPALLALPAAYWTIHHISRCPSTYKKKKS